MTDNAKYQAAYYQRHKTEYRRKILELGDFKCALCGIVDRRVLELAHIDGDGGKHRRKSGGIGYYKEMYKLLKDKKARILCRNCNWVEYCKRTGFTNLI